MIRLPRSAATVNALWMVLASFWFALMAVGIKYASASFGIMEIVLYRSIVSTVFMVIVVRSRGIGLRTNVPGMHLWRSVIGVTSMMAWFYAIAHLPLPTAMTLNYMSGIWIATILTASALLRRQPLPERALLAAVALGFGGVVLALHPTIANNQLLAGLVGMTSGLGAALAYMQVSALGQTGEPEERTVFYFAIGSFMIGLIGMLATQTNPIHPVDTASALWLLPVGLFASLGQWSMTRAYRDGPHLLVASMQYSGIIFATALGLALFGDQLTLTGWLGIALILASGLVATVLRGRRAIDNPPYYDPHTSPLDHPHHR